MKRMKKIFSVLLAVTMLATVFTGCGNTKEGTTKDDSDNSSKKVGIVAMIENGAFTDMRDGIIEELKANGYTDDNIDYQCAAGDSTALSSIVSNMTDGTYDMVFTIATPSTQAFVNAESDTPVFFCAVSAPVAAGVLTEMESPDKNATGTSNAIPVSAIFELAQATTPVKKYGLIYSGNEDNATNTIEQAKEYLESQGIEFVEKTAPTSSDIEAATNALISEGAEAIFIPNDSIIQDGIAKLVEICNEKKIPTYCSSATTVASGCFATLAIDDKGIGKKTVDIAMEYVNGKDIKDIPAQVVGIDYCSVNTTAMKALGLTKEDINTEYEINELGE
jgi:putative ABC transport system substrate-binding protein